LDHTDKERDADIEAYKVQQSQKVKQKAGKTKKLLLAQMMKKELGREPVLRLDEAEGLIKLRDLMAQPPENLVRI
jgi:hypothetical protein